MTKNSNISHNQLNTNHFIMETLVRISQRCLNVKQKAVAEVFS